MSAPWWGSSAFRQEKINKDVSGFSIKKIVIKLKMKKGAKFTPVIGIQGPERFRQKGPITEDRGEEFAELGMTLKVVDEDDGERDEGQQGQHGVHGDALAVDEGEGDKNARQEEKHADDVDNGEPTVLSRDPAQLFAQGHRNPHKRDGIENENPNDVEEEVN